MKPLYKINLTAYDAKQWQANEAAEYYGHPEKKQQLTVIDTNARDTDIDLTVGANAQGSLTDTFLRGYAQEFLGPRVAHYHVYDIAVTAEIFRNDTGEKIYDTWFYFSFPYLKSLEIKETGRETGRESGIFFGLFDRFKG